MKRFSAFTVLITLAASMIAAMVLQGFAGCNLSAQPAAKHPVDVITFNSNGPELRQEVTTQKAAVESQMAADKNAGGLVTTADEKVVAVNTEKPDTRLASADTDLRKATTIIVANQTSEQQTIDAQAKTISGLTTHISGDDALLAKARQEAAEKAAALTDRDTAQGNADKANGFIKYHANDVWGAGTHRVVHELSWGLIITLAILAIGVGIVGGIYGLPKVTNPALTWVEWFINGARVALWHAAKFIWTAIPIAGHQIHVWLEEIRFFRTTATVTKIVTPIAPAAIKAAA